MSTSRRSWAFSCAPEETLILRLPRASTLLAALLGLALAWCGAPSSAEAQNYRGLIAQGWTFMEAGNFRKAEESFKGAFATTV